MGEGKMEGTFFCDFFLRFFRYFLRKTEILKSWRKKKSICQSLLW